MKACVNHHLGLYISELRLPPEFNLLHHWIIIPLHLINADRYGIQQRKVLRMLGQHRLELSTEHHIFTHSDTIADHETEAH
jgi:hypothetical protein